MESISGMRLVILALAILQFFIGEPAAIAWEPTKPIEFIIPAGTGGGADQMARLIAVIAEKHKFSPRPLIPINKSGGAGAEGFLYVKEKKGDPHVIIITLSNLFTTPLHTGVPFNWKDLTPLARMALDEFVLWVNAEAPYKTAKEYVDAVKAQSAGTNRMKMGGTGSAQEDQIITIQLEQALGIKFTYVPFKGGGEVCVNLVGKHVDSTVNNPIEAVAQWRGGKLRPLCVFDAKPMAYDEQVADGKAWKDIPTCKSQGLDMEYLMLRGIFMSPKATKDQVAYYIDLFNKVRATPDWQEFMKNGAFNTTFMTGDAYAKWVDTEEKRHQALMKEAGFLEPSN